MFPVGGLSPYGLAWSNGETGNQVVDVSSGISLVFTDAENTSKFVSFEAVDIIIDFVLSGDSGQFYDLHFRAPNASSDIFVVGSQYFLLKDVGTTDTILRPSLDYAAFSRNAIPLGKELVLHVDLSAGFDLVPGREYQPIFLPNAVEISLLGSSKLGFAPSQIWPSLTYPPLDFPHFSSVPPVTEARYLPCNTTKPAFSEIRLAAVKLAKRAQQLSTRGALLVHVV